MTRSPFGSFAFAKIGAVTWLKRAVRTVLDQPGLYRHPFGCGSAQHSFEEPLAGDPESAIAYWGIALSSRRGHS